MKHSVACLGFCVAVIIFLGHHAEARLLRGRPHAELSGGRRSLAQVRTAGFWDPSDGYYGSAASANTFGSGNMDNLGLRGGWAYGSLAADAGYAGVSLSSLQERGDRLVTRYRGGDPFDI